MQIENIKSKLIKFHKNLGVEILSHQSPLTGNQFQGEFNVSGFHKEILDLSKSPKRFFGIDKCMRLKEEVNLHSSYIFEMGIYAESVNLNESFSEPFKDKIFLELQNKTIKQFLALLDCLEIDKSKLEATYLGNITFGVGIGRDRALQRKYSFQEDIESRRILEKNAIKTFPVNSIQNVDIHPVEGALVGPRVEIAYNGAEIATIVFDCFKIQNGTLIPINYIGGYAMGIERLTLTISDKKDLIEINKQFSEKLNELAKESPAIKSSLFDKEKYIVIYGLEVFNELKNINSLSEGQNKVLNNFKKMFKEALDKLGLQNRMF